MVEGQAGCVFRGCTAKCVSMQAALALVQAGGISADQLLWLAQVSAAMDCCMELGLWAGWVALRHGLLSKVDAKVGVRYTTSLL